MSKNLGVDAQLSKDCYLHSNVNDGAVEGWVRLAVPEFTNTNFSIKNFSAQLYEFENENYKIAYRGNTDISVQDNAENIKNFFMMWTDEMTLSVKFTYYAIKTIQKIDTKRTFNEAKALLEVTGYRLGGFEAEINAQLFGLNGSSLDSPGAAHMKKMQAWTDIKLWIQAQEPEAKLDSGDGNFIARKYTNLFENNQKHFINVKKDNSGMILIQNSALPAMQKLALRIGVNITKIHGIDFVIIAEATKGSLVTLAYAINEILCELFTCLQQAYKTDQFTFSPMIMEKEMQSSEKNELSKNQKSRSTSIDEIYSFSGSPENEGDFESISKYFKQNYFTQKEIDEFDDEEMLEEIERQMVNVEDAWRMFEQRCMRIISKLLAQENVKFH
jgi:hypothetical protein